jgi:hypothetical protein
VAIDSELHQNGNTKKFFTQNTEEWTALTDNQYDELITELVKKYEIGNWEGKPSQIYFDPWGHRFTICYRNMGYDLRIVSKGVDGIYGTKDDLVAPWGKLPPPIGKIK